MSDRTGGPAAPWHAQTSEQVLDRLGVDVEQGLSQAEVESRRREHGRNRLREAETRPWWRILLAQLKSIVIYLLGSAAVLALLTGRDAEAIAIVAVIVVNTTIGFVSEWQAVRSMAALRAIGAHRVRVRRGGEEREAAATDLVPGDLVLLEAGDLVPADLRLVEADRLRVSQASLTGESVPDEKSVDPVDESAELADRSDMLYKGTSISDGQALGVVVEIGSKTELGRIAELAEQAGAAVTPLQARLDQLGRRLAWATVGIAIVVAVVGLLIRRQQATLVIETALALGVAAIPEGLPIVSTIALARGMALMARRNALVNRLTAVETLGATRVIISDKTGTLTQNRMRLREIVTPLGEHSFAEREQVDANEVDEMDEMGPHVRRALEIGVLCNAASLESGADGEAEDGRGDPTEIALLAAGRRIGLEREKLLASQPERRVVGFDPAVKMMATFHSSDSPESTGDTLRVAVKGAPEAVLGVCDRLASGEDTVAGETGSPLDEQAIAQWQERADALAGEGLRVLAVAEKRVDSERAEPYEGLCLLGLAGLLDPPRERVKAAIDECQAAGIRVEMVTGDQPETARAIARAVGIVGDVDDPGAEVMRGRDIGSADDPDEAHLERIHRANIFARVSPEQKLDLVRIDQDRGEIVAMTGDGVNDAPALQQADIGVAMGRRGTEAAKQAADMVLKDDAFETIVAAVELGRVIFANIRKSVMFMLCTNVAEVLAVTVATLAGWPLPLSPLQILYLNVLTDVFPALALGVGPGSGQEMTRPPRDSREAVLTRSHGLEIAGWAMLLATCVLASLLLARHWLGTSEAAAVTVSFLTIGFGKLWFSFNLKAPGTPLLRNEITHNMWIWAAIALCSVLLIAAVHLPVLSTLLRTESLEPRAWGLMLGMSLIPLIVGQAVRALQGRATE